MSQYSYHKSALTACTHSIAWLTLSASCVYPIAAGAAESGRSKSGALEEIIVTAQKRQERLQDVPVPVTVINAEPLANASLLRTADYYATVPGLDLHVGPAGGWQLTMRGLSSGSGIENPSVGIVIDDIAYTGALFWGGSGIVPEIDPGNVSSIEVLRGPQGTLYGAGSLAGLLKYVTVQPNTDKLNGRLQVGSNSIKGGDDYGYSVRGSVNVPVSDTFAIRASGFNYVQPGFIDNVATGKNDVNEIKGQGAQVSGLWRATDALTVKLSALAQRIEPQGTWNVDGSSGDLKQSDTIGAGVFERNIQAYGVTVIADLGAAELTSLSGYGHFDFSGTNSLAPALQVTEDFENDRYSQELRVSIPFGERLTWLLGAFFSKDQFSAGQGIPFVDPDSGAYTGRTLLDRVGWRGAHEEIAAFTNLTFKFTDRFDLQLGGRQAQYEGDFQQVWIGPLQPDGIIPPQLGSPYYPPHVSYKDNAFTYLVTPRVRFSEDWMVYARLASGYRTGGPNSMLGNAVLPILEPDTTTNYELGAKGSLLDGRIRVDVSAYHIDWKDMQVFTIYLLPSDIPAAAYVNGPDAESEGLEVSFEMNPWQGLQVTLWGAWNDAKLSTRVPPQLTAFGGEPGDRVPGVARFTGHFHLQQEFSMGETSSAYVGAGIDYRGSRMSEFVARDSGLPRVELPSYTEVDVSAGVRLSTWEVGIYANNLLDKRAGVGYSAVTRTGQPNQPRTIGLTLTRAFE